jgi:hypothetical protein
LLEASENGEVVRIIYHGGSQPGTVRSISIIAISELEVRARDLAVGIDKIFKLEKIELAEVSTSTPEYNPVLPPAVELTGSIREVLSAELEQLQSLGWHIEVADDVISLHRFFMNGKPRKTPDMQLTYNEYTIDAFVDIDGVFKEERRKSRRPYRVDSRNIRTAKTFTKISGAVTCFLAEAKVLAPTDLI